MQSLNVKSVTSALVVPRSVPKAADTMLLCLLISLNISVFFVMCQACNASLSSGSLSVLCLSCSSSAICHRIPYMRFPLQAMVKDTKLNPMLLPASKLKKILAAHDLHGNSGRCGVQSPNKRLW